MRYKVLKEFVGMDGVMRSPKSKNCSGVMEVCEKDFCKHLSYFQGLINYGHLGNVDEDEDASVWCRGQKMAVGTGKKYYYVPEPGVVESLTTSDLSCYNIEFGNFFNTEQEAKAYCDHIQLENELINIAVRDYGAKTKRDNYHSHGFETTIDGKRVIFEGIYFWDTVDSYDFEIDNGNRLRWWASYFMEEEQE